MAYSIERAKYESHLAAAHRRLWEAQRCAFEMNDIGAEHDVAQILREVTRLAQDSLRSSKRPLRGQLTLDGP